jgi:hypothetical protein
LRPMRTSMISEKGITIPWANKSPNSRFARIFLPVRISC